MDHFSSETQESTLSGRHSVASGAICLGGTARMGMSLHANWHEKAVFSGKFGNFSQ
jgi:hypothetical protein